MDKFTVKLKQDSDAIKQFIQHDLPLRIGKKGVDLFAENFQKEGFQNGGLQKWKEVKRRLDPRIKDARSSRKILSGNTADLGRSLRYIPELAKVMWYSDVSYAEAHNEGTTTAGRSRNVTIPQRKFIGDSRELEAIIKQEMDKFMNNLFK
ncbi:MAG: hypothetical protein NTZ33_13945 [Bacteroidetes bacterium]|nr:hypothetical protein [Bacteroidota bacterium]